MNSASGNARSGFALLLVVVLALSALMYFGRSGRTPPAPKPAAFSGAVAFDDALARSNAEGRPVLVFATADWCGPCQLLKRGALAAPSVEHLIKGGTIPVYADVTSGNGVSADTALRLNISAVPALIMVWNGREIARHEGNTSPASLEKWLKDGIALAAGSR